MKKLDILYGSSLKLVHGVNKVTDSLLKGKNIFEGNGINLRKIYATDGVIDCSKAKSLPIGEFGNAAKHSFIRKVRVFLKTKLLVGFSPLVYLRYKITVLISADRVVDRYLATSEDPADIILFQDFNTAYTYLNKRKDKSIKTAIISHSTEDLFHQLGLSYPEFVGGIYEDIIRKKQAYVLENVDKIIFVSKQPVDFFKQKYGEKVEFVYNGIEDIDVQITDKQVNKDEPVKLICVGSISERKGQDILIESVKLLDENSRKRFKFYIVGEGDIKGELIKRINNYGLSDNFEFLGLRNDVSSLLKEMDCYVLPSRNEGLPIAIIEALREGLYIIASNVGGIPELLSSDYSELIRPEPEDLKIALQNVISGKIDFKQNSKIAREVFLKNFSLDSMINKYCTILRSL